MPASLDSRPCTRAQQVSQVGRLCLLHRPKSSARAACAGPSRAFVLPARARLLRCCTGRRSGHCCRQTARQQSPAGPVPRPPRPGGCWRAQPRWPACPLWPLAPWTMRSWSVSAARPHCAQPEQAADRARIAQLVAGERIEASFGASLGLSTLVCVAASLPPARACCTCGRRALHAQAAAALGNLVSDVAGVGLAQSIEAGSPPGRVQCRACMLLSPRAPAAGADAQGQVGPADQPVTHAEAHAHCQGWAPAQQRPALRRPLGPVRGLVDVGPASHGA